MPLSEPYKLIRTKDGFEIMDVTDMVPIVICSFRGHHANTEAIAKRMAAVNRLVDALITASLLGVEADACSPVDEALELAGVELS